MLITILGSGTCIPTVERASPGLTVEIENQTVLIDPGSGSLQRLVAAGLTVESIRTVLVTHFHPDHTGELVPLLFALNVPGYYPPGRLTLAGPPGLRQLYRSLRKAYGHWITLEEGRLEIRELEPGLHSFAGWSCRALSMKHSKPSLGFRIRTPGGPVFAYSGDTEYCPGLVQLLANADAGLVDCSHPIGHEARGHLTPDLAGRAAAEAGLKRLILTHLYPTCDGQDLVSQTRTSGYAGPVEVAFDGMRIELD